MSMKIAVVRMSEYNSLLNPVLEKLNGSEIVEIQEHTEVPKGYMALTCSRIATQNSSQPVFDLSHGVFWNKSGAEVFDTGVREDYYVASSPYEIEMLSLKGILPRIRKVYPVGRPDLDTLYNLEKSRPKNRRKSVLYAPTWNYELNGGIVEIKKNILELKDVCSELNLDFRVAMHPYILDRHWDRFLSEQGIRYRKNDEPFIPLLSYADILVGDCSSNIEQFLLTGRPIVLYNSFDWFNGFAYPDSCMLSDDIEPLAPRLKDVRKVSYQFTGQHMIKGCIELALNEGYREQSARSQLKSVLWGDVFDGKCTERVVHAIEDAYEDCRRRGEVE